MTHTITPTPPTYEAAAAAAEAKEAEGYQTTVQNIGTSEQPQWVCCYWKE